LVVELSYGHRFFLADLRPEQHIQQVLRSQILDWLVARALDGDRPNEEFFLRGNRYLKRSAVAGHVEYRGSDDRRLPDHANLRRPRGQEKSLNLMILVDDTAVLRS